MSGAPSQTDNSYVLANQLRPGLFVLIDLPWFQHGFTLSNFKLRNEQQVRELRALDLPRYRYDPARSDPEALAAITPAAAVLAAPSTPSIRLDEIVDPALRERQALREKLAKRQEQISNIERAFGKAVSTMKGLNRNLLSRPRETLEEMNGLVGQMIDAFLDSPEATLHVMGDKVGGEEVYFHSLNITILSMMLAKGLGFDEATARDMGIGAMLHDVGLMDVPDRVLMTDSNELNTAERKLRMMHVDYGVSMGTRWGLSPGALAIIAQHHEKADGSGYPRGLKAVQMTEAARLVSLVNYYDNLCNPVNVKKAMTPHAALSYIYAQRRARFDHKALQLMIRSLGVYPPGSIVQLSNEAMATVTSVNPNRPLRPWVLVYDETLPKDEAPMLDLDQHPGISITKAIAPAMLPPKVLAYLNPRKRVTYFFDGDSSEPGKTA